MSDTPLTSTRFSELGVSESLLDALNQVGYRFCTPIQERALPIVLNGKDVAGQAQTGTGKTAAFLIGTLQYLIKHPAHSELPGQPRALILAPTRELAIQIHQDAAPLAKALNLRLALVYGGTGYEKQRTHVSQGVDIIIATPGRVIDYFKQGVFSLKGIQVVVIDEADRMFDLGFIKDVRYLLRRMPPPDKRLGLLFSATLSLRVTELAYEHMNNPALVRVNQENVTVARVKESIYFAANNEKIPLLLGLLKKLEQPRSIVFVNTKRAGEAVQLALSTNNVRVALLTGDVPQHRRQQLLTDFQQGLYDVLVATDIAARGLHIPDVSHVFNFDLPQDPEDYVHRIGRTGRFGAEGDAVSFGDEETIYHLPAIEQYIGHKLETIQVTDDLLSAVEPSPRMPRRNPHGGNKDGQRRQGSRRSRPKASGKPNVPRADA